MELSGNAQEEDNQPEAEEAGDSGGQGMAQGLRGDKAQDVLEWQRADRIDLIVPAVTVIRFYTGVELFELLPVAPADR